MTEKPGDSGRGRSVSATPHDALFRAILDSPDRAAVLIREYLPEELRQELAETSPRLVDGSFVDEALRGSQSDRLFEVDLKDGKPALVYVLIEHKSTPELRTPLQLLGYQLRIWDRHARGQGGSFRALPPIVPLVFYHGRESWTVPRSLFEMIDAPESLQLFVRSLGYVLHDLGQIELGHLSSDEGLMAGLAALKFVIELNVPQEVLYHILAALPQDDESYKIAVLTYIIRTYHLERSVLETTLRAAQPESWEAMMGTIGEILSREARQEGLQVGRAEGKAEGEAEGEARGEARGEAKGLARSLVRLLERRFGPLSQDITARIAGAELETIERWFDAAIDAAALADVFSADSP